MTKRTTDIALDLSDSESQALYDDHAKRLLGYRWILAAFLKEVLPGAAGYTVAQIVEMIDPDIQISTTRLHPDLRVRGLNTEYKDVPDEHDNGKKKKRSRQIRFDILFRIRLPEGARRFLINIEIQKEKPQKYVLLDRATAYGAQEITSQLNVEYLEGSYSDMLPVCSIWIVAGQEENTISTWELKEETDGIPGMWTGRSRICAIWGRVSMSRVSGMESCWVKSVVKNADTGRDTWLLKRIWQKE